MRPSGVGNKRSRAEAAEGASTTGELTTPAKPKLARGDVPLIESKYADSESALVASPAASGAGAAPTPRTAASSPALSPGLFVRTKSCLSDDLVAKFAELGLDKKDGIRAVENPRTALFASQKQKIKERVSTDGNSSIGFGV